MRKFRELLAVIRKHYPQAGKISMFSRIDSIAAKSDEELRELKELGVSQLYVGAENGNDEALDLMNKGHNSAEAVEQVIAYAE